MDPKTHTRSSAYTFGDSHLAAERLALLASVYEQPSRDFLGRFCARAGTGRERADAPGSAFAQGRPALALDLGCGPGHTTTLLHEVMQPERTVGIDNSAAHLRRARARILASDGDSISYLEHDLRVVPFPVEPADVVFARFILTHLAEPERVLRHWSTLLRRDGILLLQESSRLECAHPAFIRYYGLVGELQRLHSQSLYIGRDLVALAGTAGMKVVHGAPLTFQRPAAIMARLHAMNLRSW